jgi:hypothetical protein
MIEWVIAIPERAKDVLTELTLTKANALVHADALLWRWKEDMDWPSQHPHEAVGIVKFLADSASIQPWSQDDAVVILEFLLTAGATEVEVGAAAHAVAVLTGNKAATELAERLRK